MAKMPMAMDIAMIDLKEALFNAVGVCLGLAGLAWSVPAFFGPLGRVSPQIEVVWTLMVSPCILSICGLALYFSLRRHGGHFALHALSILLCVLGSLILSMFVLSSGESNLYRGLTALTAGILFPLGFMSSLGRQLLLRRRVEYGAAQTG